MREWSWPEKLQLLSPATEFSFSGEVGYFQTSADNDFRSFKDLLSRIVQALD